MQGVDFLVYLHTVKKEKFSLIAGARSALSAVFPADGGVSFGKSPLVSKAMKGIYRLNPSFPKKVTIFDADELLHYISSLPPNKHLNLEMLTKKLVTLNITEWAAGPVYC